MLNRKKKTFVLGSLLVCSSVIGVVALTTQGSFSKLAKADSSYTIRFTSAKNCYQSSTPFASTYAFTDLNGVVSVGVCGFTDDRANGNWGALAKDAYFDNLSAINGLESITVTLASSSSASIYYGSSDYSKGQTSHEDFTGVSSFTSYLGYSAPSYFCLYATSDITVTSLVATYSCKPSIYHKEFGSYPTSAASSSVSSTLTASYGTATTLPGGAYSTWLDYGYYENGAVVSYMWYQDVTLDSVKYRGVYFTHYRYSSCVSTTTLSYHYQDANGYNLSTVYWFKYDPIVWRILSTSVSDGVRTYLLLSDSYIDSQDYYHAASTNSRYANQYDISDIRTWLNGTFYNLAFDETDKTKIVNTTFDNSASTTSSGTNPYACDSTLDNVSLPSYQDMINSDYGFNTSADTADTKRILAPTDYAKSQGILAYADPLSAYGWTRSPHQAFDYMVNTTTNQGKVGGTELIYTTSIGVAPMIYAKI